MHAPAPFDSAQLAERRPALLPFEGARSSWGALPVVDKRTDSYVRWDSYVLLVLRLPLWITLDKLD